MGVLRAGRGHPAIVDVHVHVAVVDHAARDHGVGRVAHDLVAHAVYPDVPTIPAHVRRQRQPVADDDAELPLRGAQLVRGAKHDHVLAANGRAAADPAGLAVQRQALGQPLGGELHWPPARGGDRKQQRMAGANAEDFAPLIFGCGDGFGVSTTAASSPAARAALAAAQAAMAKIIEHVQTTRIGLLLAWKRFEFTGSLPLSRLPGPRGDSRPKLSFVARQGVVKRLPDGSCQESGFR